MVLDTYDEDRDILIFKNTYDDPESGLTKKFEIERTDSNSPTELYFVHIEVEDMASLPFQEVRIRNKKQEMRAKSKSHTLAAKRNTNRSTQSSSRR